MQTREDDRRQLHPEWTAHTLPNGRILHVHNTENKLSCRTPWLRMNVRNVASLGVWNTCVCRTWPVPDVNTQRCTDTVSAHVWYRGVVSQVQGGVLAEEMGLGKTIEVPSLGRLDYRFRGHCLS